MNLRKLILLCLTVGFALSCSENPNIDVNPNEYIPTALKTTIIESGNSFAFDIFNEIVKNEDSETNVFISPLSMYYALAMAANGANGETFDEFAILLGWNDLEKAGILQAIKELNEFIFPTNSKVTVEVANSIWPEIYFPIKENFVTETQNYFNAEVNSFDVTDPSSVDIINSWIENKTHGKIKDMLDKIPPEAALYLINAIYFKGDWKYEFSEDDNFEDSFYCRNGSTQNTTYMAQTTNLQLFVDNEINAVRLPYLDSNYYMTIIVPNSDEGFYELNTSTWNLIANNSSTCNTTLYLPKFKFDFGTRLINEELNALGLQKAFIPFIADFTSITDTSINISRVLHKAFIEVNEAGSEAAAATIIEFEYSTVSVGDKDTPYLMEVNKPFIFVISEEQTQNIMFIGRVEMPEYE